MAINLSQAEHPTTVQGNFIGTDVTGLAALGNGNYGVVIFNGNGHIIASNVVSANFVGVGTNAGPAVVIQGNLIGTDAAGLAAIPNQIAGVGAFNGGDGTQIGGAAGAAGTPCVFPCNLISGNSGFGILLGTGGSSIGQDHDVVQGNCIGTQIDCASPLPNGTDGIQIGLQASDETIGGTAPGEGNVIAFNDNGINMDDGVRNAIRGNSIFSNDGLGIDLGGTGVTPNDPGDPDTGANLLQNFPIVTSVEPALTSGPQGASTRIRGFIRGAAATQLELDFFSNDSCADRPQEFLEGHRYLGSSSVTTDGTGFAAIDVTLPVDVAANDPRVGDRHRPAREHLGVLPAPAALRLSDVRDAGGRNEPVDHRHGLPGRRDGHGRRRRGGQRRRQQLQHHHARPRLCSRRAPSTT